MEIEDCRIDMLVRSVDGRTGKIVSLFSDGEARVNFAPGRDSYKLERVSDLTPVSDPCEGCQKLFSMNESLEYWQTRCRSARRDAAHWREELTKLQREAMSEKLLMSREARRVIEFLTHDGPRAYDDITVCFGSDWTAITDGLIEARDAGRIALVDGKYEIVRD